MIKSMTGYGRCEAEEGERKFTVEVKGVNHRYLDVNIRLPKKLNYFEGSIRTLLKQYVHRGKVDIFLFYEDRSPNQVSLKYNEALAAEYLSYFKQMEQKFQLKNDICVSSLSRYPEVLTMEEQVTDEEQLWNSLKKVLSAAFGQFVDTRMTEGAHLKTDILSKLEGMQQLVACIEAHSPEIIATYRKKLEEKLNELLENAKVDDSRIATEAVIFADRICTDEEVVRLKSHISHMKETLCSEEGGIGRKLDFIAQEMNREANTILSKANDLSISNYAIDLKTEIEKVREQIQNIE